MKKLTQEEKDYVDKAIEGIYRGFDWNKTKQSSEYWMTVVDNLQEIRDFKEHTCTCKKCGRKLE